MAEITKDIFRIVLLSLVRNWANNVQGSIKFNETILYFYPKDINSQTINISGARLCVKFWYEARPHTEDCETRIDRILSSTPNS